MSLEPTSSPYLKGLILVHAAVLLFGLAGLFADFIALPAEWIVMGRTGFAAGFLLFFLPLLKIAYLPARLHQLWGLLASGVLLAFHWFAFFRSIQLSNVALGLLTFSSFPVFTILLEPIFGQGKITAVNLVVGIITMLGVGLVIPPLELHSASTQGAIWGILAGLSFAVLAMLNRKLVVDNPGRRIAFWQNLVAFLCLVWVPFKLSLRPSLKEWGLLLLLGVVFTGVSHSLFIDGLRRVPARTASIIASLEPVYGILGAFLLLEQEPASKTLLGGVVIVGASLFASWKG